MRYSAQQRAYSQALRSSEMAEAKAAAHERAFLAARGATDRRGFPARRLWQVEDDAAFDALEAEYQADPEAVELQSTEMASRAALIKAEKALVAWALSIVPAGVRATLAPAAEMTTPPGKRSLTWPCVWTPPRCPAAVRKIPPAPRRCRGCPFIPLCLFPSW